MELINNGFGFYFGGIILAALFSDIIALVDINKKKYESSLEKLIWISIIIFFPLIGCLLYLFFGGKIQRN